MSARKRILYIGTPVLHRLVADGTVPSHWLYGAEEMLHDGHDVIFESERKNAFHDLALIRRYSPDVIFIPNLNLHAHWMLLLLSALRMVRTPILAIAHHADPERGLKRTVNRVLLNGVSYLFTLSELTRQHIINNGWKTEAKVECLQWGADMDFYRKYTACLSDDGYFISTGKEGRDFDLLIEAFQATGAPLKIITAREHAGQNHEYLTDKCKDIPNIEVIITENSSEVYPMMVKQMSKAKALVCPLKRDCLTYCVGLSTVVDAEGLGKPLIITRNPYHDTRRMSRFMQVETVEDWKAAIQTLRVSTAVNRSSIDFSMAACYRQWVRIISER